MTKCSAENLQETADTQNRMHATGGTDYAYDAAGNMTKDVTFNHNYSYDAESRIAQVDSGATAYTYNAEENRVRKDVSGSPSNEYFYFGGNIIAELNPASGAETNYIFFNGERVARRDPSGSVEYYFSDHLKTTDIVTDATGNIKNESDFYPWGGELQLSANDPNNHYKFTGKERDSETGLDYFGARYYSNGLGRFITVDPGRAHLDNPQSWNRYVCVLNNPLFYIDPNGANSVSAVYTIGTADVTIWSQSDAHYDPAGLLQSLYGVRVSRWMDSVAIGENPFMSGDRRGVNAPDNPALGGCLLLCAYGYTGTSYGIKIQVSFSHGPDGNGPIDGARIETIYDPSIHFMGNVDRSQFTFVPGGTPIIPEVHVDIASGPLQGMSEEELAALQKAAAARPDAIRWAIYSAASAERYRRAHKKIKRLETSCNQKTDGCKK